MAQVPFEMSGVQCHPKLFVSVDTGVQCHPKLFVSVDTGEQCHPKSFVSVDTGVQYHSRLNETNTKHTTRPQQSLLSLQSSVAGKSQLALYDPDG